MYIYTKLKKQLVNLEVGAKQVMLLAFILLGISQAFAQVPTNDEPCNATTISAIALTPNAACTYQTFTNVDASNSTTTGIPNPTCANFTDADVWFTVTVPTSATAITVDTRNIGMSDGGMSLYTATGNCPNLTMTEIGCSDDGSTNPGMPRLTVNQPAGTVIYIRMWGFGGETGTFGICVTANIPPSNDECTAATNLTVNSNLTCTTVTGGTTLNATQSANTPIPTCAVAGAQNDDVWYTFTATGATHRVSLLNITGGSTAMVIAAYSGNCTSLTQIGCVAGNTLDLGGLTAGTVYYIRVYTNVTSNATANFNICVGTPPPPPANDNCTGAINAPVNAGYSCTNTISGTLTSATGSTGVPAPGCNATGANDDVWYSFVATNVEHRISFLNVTGTTTGITSLVYSGTCNALVQLACNGTNQYNVTGLTPGTTYYVRVYSTVATVGTTTDFTLCIGTPPPPPANDDCINAISAPVNPNYLCGSVTPGILTSATPSPATVPAPGCNAGGANDDVWFKFIATNTEHRISFLNIAGSATTITSLVYSGTCGSLVQLACNGTNQYNVTGLTVGDTYYVRVFSTDPTIGTETTFNLCIGTPPPPPSNDNCTGAISLTVNPNYLCGTTTLATLTSATLTTGVPVPSCNATGANDDVWFSFVATNTSHRISFLNVTGTTTAITSLVYSGTCGALTELICNGTNLYNVTGLIPGNTYYVRVFSTSTTVGTETVFNICIGTPPPPPANDNCTGAISLPVNANQLCGNTVLGSTAGATLSNTTPFPTCGVTNSWDDDVWYSFVATSNNHTVSLLNVTGTTTNMATAVYSGTCGNLIQIACTAADPNVINLSTLTPGNTYYVRVFTETTDGTEATFNICIGTPGPGAVCSSGNPFCSTSGVVYPSVTNQPSLGGGGVYGCLGSTPNPTWFAFQVSSPGNLVFQVSQTNTAGAGIDVDYAAWGPFTSQADGCTQIAAAGITPISCSYSTAAVETITIPNSIVGQWYVVLITNFNGGAGTISFNTTTGNVGATNCNIVCNTNAFNNGPICAGGGTFNLSATALPGSTFSWTGPNGFTSTQQNPTGIVAPTAPGNYTYTVTSTAGSVVCSGATTLIVTNPPAAPTVTSPVNYCQNSTATPLTATATGTNTLLWYTAATGGTGSTTAPTPTTATIGTTTYYVSQVAGQCESPRSAIVVNVTPSTTPAPTVVSPISYCQGATATALTATGTNLLWYTGATGGVGSTTAPTPSTANVGSTTYYVSQTIGTCESPRASIIVTINAASPNPTVVSPVAYCTGATAVPLSATGTNLLWYTTATGGTGSTTAPTPSTATAGTFVFYVTQQTGACPSARVPITVNVTATPVAPTVTSPVVYCQGATAVPLTATGTNLLWYTVATGGTGSATAPTPSTTTVGNTNFYVSATNGTCEGPRALITVTVNATPAAPTVTTPVVYCQGATAVPLTATGTNLLWYTTPTGGTGSATAPTPSTTTVGSTNYYVTQTNASNCQSTRALIVVTVNATPNAPTVTSPIAYCQNATAVPLTATGTNLLWYTTATGGTGSATAPTPSTTAGGSTTFYVSSTIGTCEGPRAAIVVNVTALPTAPSVTTPVVYCQGATAVPVTATGNGVLWYTTATGGTGSTTAPTPSTATPGTITYYASQFNGSCEGPRAAVVVTVNPTPGAPTVVTPVNICQGTTATALTATGTNLLWYTTATGSTGSATAPIPSTSTVGSTTYYVSQSTGTCEGPRAAIAVNITPALTVDAGPDVNIGYGLSTTLAGTATTGANYLWTANGPLALTSATILNPIANPLQTTIYTLTVSDPTNLCPSKSDNMTVTVIINCINVRNAFTPNGDGINDTWKVYDQAVCLKPNSVLVNVFNRYGSKVFESKNYTNTWDGTYKGKPVPDGTYYAVIEFTLFDGTKRFVKTDVTVLR
ncbi:gliding motility-associated C-terminal domain-containing protein [Ferruginibacter yonginensis]|uniref:Gliding motility-associated C-terminal domain-containing protein n=1 Tax=Ferruginibacter yonginensis TaxID=1310416 RepID=A0ABV8QVJ7_9BACT